MCTILLSMVVITNVRHLHCCLHFSIYLRSFLFSIIINYYYTNIHILNIFDSVYCDYFAINFSEHWMIGWGGFFFLFSCVSFFNASFLFLNPIDFVLNVVHSYRLSYRKWLSLALMSNDRINSFVHSDKTSFNWKAGNPFLFLEP